MAETSGLWTTDAAPAGHQVTSYTQAIASIMHKIIAACSGKEGVVPNILNELAPSTTGNNNCRVATGGAMVDGLWYNNSANVDLTIDSPSAGHYRIDRVVIRATWANFEAEATVIKNTVEDDPAPAITQTSGVTYDIPIAIVRVNEGGVIAYVTDERTFAIVPVDGVTMDVASDATLRVKALGISSGYIAADAVTTAKILDGNVTEGKIGALAVTEGKIGALAVTEGKIGALAVTSGKIGADAVIAGKIADGAVDATATLANDIVDDTKAGNRVPQFYRRQGGSATVWSTAGETDYTPGAVRMQGGTVHVVEANAITFPVAFSYVPIIFANALVQDRYVYLTSISETGATFEIRTLAGVLASADVYWLAIGPE